MEKGKFIIGGVGFNAVTRESLFSLIGDCFSGDRKYQIVKANSEFLCRALSDKKFMTAINNAEICFADGIGVLWAAKYLSLKLTPLSFIRPLQAVWQAFYTLIAIVLYPKYLKNPLPETIPGVEALKIMLKAAEEKSVGVFFFGATQNDLEKSITNIKRKFPNLKISGALNGYDWQRNKRINPVEIINQTDAKLLIVALGSPLQEYWIKDNFDKLKKVKVAVGEGGSLAFLAGTFKRAPKWLNKIGLEWLWRLFMNRSLTPQTGSRLKRVWNAVPVFIVKTIAWKVKNG